MAINTEENKKFTNRILASILYPKTFTREETAYLDEDNRLMITSTMTIKHIAENTIVYNPLAPNITFVTYLKITPEILECVGITDITMDNSSIHISNGQTSITISTHHVESFKGTEEFTKGHLFSESYNTLLNILEIKNKRLTVMMKKMARRKFNWAIVYNVSDKIYTATVKSESSMYKDKMESHYMYIEDSTNIYTHTSAIGIIDELLATPYKFHGTSINYTAIDYTRRNGKFVIGNIPCEAEATTILLDVANTTNNIARFLI